MNIHGLSGGWPKQGHVPTLLWQKSGKGKIQDRLKERAKVGAIAGNPQIESTKPPRIQTAHIISYNSDTERLFVHCLAEKGLVIKQMATGGKRVFRSLAD